MRKRASAGLFAILAFLFMMPVSKSSLPLKNKWQIILKTAIAISIWGLTIEFIQRFFIPGRSFDLLDWAADSFGVLVAVIACRKFYLK